MSVLNVQPSCAFSGCKFSLKNAGKVFLLAALIVGVALTIHYSTSFSAQFNSAEWGALACGAGLLTVSTGLVARKIFRQTDKKNEETDESFLKIDESSSIDFREQSIVDLEAFLYDGIDEDAHEL